MRNLILTNTRTNSTRIITEGELENFDSTVTWEQVLPVPMRKQRLLNINEKIELLAEIAELIPTLNALRCAYTANPSAVSFSDWVNNFYDVITVVDDKVVELEKRAEKKSKYFAIKGE